MDVTDSLCRMLDERGIEYVSIGGITNWEHAEFDELADGSDTRLIVYGATPEQAISATVGRCDTMGLWHEWEQVLFANVSDEVAQDNLNECVHELLDKAATVGAGTCHIEVHDNLAETEGMGDVWLECDECHWQMPLEPTTPRFKYCPNCRREVVDK